MENYIHVVFNSKLNIEQRVGYSRLLCPSVVTAGIKPIFQYEIFPAERLILLGLTFSFQYINYKVGISGFPPATKFSSEIIC